MRNKYDSDYEKQDKTRTGSKKGKYDFHEIWYKITFQPDLNVKVI